MSISIVTIFALISLTFAVQLRHGSDRPTSILLQGSQPLPLGCFLSGVNGHHTFPSRIGTSTQDTISCSKFCLGSVYFGMEYGNECYCGDILPSQTADNCNMKCTSGEICGGVWAVNIFQRKLFFYRTKFS